MLATRYHHHTPPAPAPEPASSELLEPDREPAPSVPAVPVPAPRTWVPLRHQPMQQLQQQQQQQPFQFKQSEELRGEPRQQRQPQQQQQEEPLSLTVRPAEIIIQEDVARPPRPHEHSYVWEFEHNEHQQTQQQQEEESSQSPQILSIVTDDEDEDENNRLQIVCDYSSSFSFTQDATAAVVAAATAETETVVAANVSGTLFNIGDASSSCSSCRGGGSGIGGIAATATTAGVGGGNNNNNNNGSSSGGGGRGAGVGNGNAEAAFWRMRIRRYRQRNGMWMYKQSTPKSSVGIEAIRRRRSYVRRREHREPIITDAERGISLYLSSQNDGVFQLGSSPTLYTANCFTSKYGWYVVYRIGTTAPLTNHITDKMDPNFAANNGDGRNKSKEELLPLDERFFDFIGSPITEPTLAPCSFKLDALEVHVRNEWTADLDRLVRFWWKTYPSSMCTLKFCTETAQASVVTFESEREPAFKEIISSSKRNEREVCYCVVEKDSDFEDYGYYDPNWPPLTAPEKQQQVIAAAADSTATAVVQPEGGGGGEGATAAETREPATFVLSLAVYVCVANDELLYLLEHAFRVRPVNLLLNARKWHLVSAKQHATLLFNGVKQFTLVTPFVKRVACFLATLPPGLELILPNFGHRKIIVADLNPTNGVATANMFERIVLGECKPNTPPRACSTSFSAYPRVWKSSTRQFPRSPTMGPGGIKCTCRFTTVVTLPLRRRVVTTTTVAMAQAVEAAAATTRQQLYFEWQQQRRE